MSDRIRSTAVAAIFLRLALAAGFLSAVADRFGLWGPPGTPGVAWGGFDPFLAYTGNLLWDLTAGVVPAPGRAAPLLDAALTVGPVAGPLLLGAVPADTGPLSQVADAANAVLPPPPPPVPA